jgi:hypothetical protein
MSDPVAQDIIERMLLAINSMPICAGEFLGDDLYRDIQTYLGYEEEEDE